MTKAFISFLLGCVLFFGCVVNQKNEFIKIAVQEAFKKGYELDSCIITVENKKEFLENPTFLTIKQNSSKYNFIDTKDFVVVKMRKAFGHVKGGGFLCFIERKSGKILLNFGEE